MVDMNGKINPLNLSKALASDLGNAPVPPIPPIFAQVHPTALSIATHMMAAHRSAEAIAGQQPGSPETLAEQAIADAEALIALYHAKVQARQALQP